MAKKEPTPAQLEARRKFAERARARAAEKKSASITPEVAASGPDLTPGEQAKETVASEADYLDLQRQVLELKQMLLGGQSLPTNQVGLQNGKLVGTLEKYSLAPKDYPDPRARLLVEKKLDRFALPVNYDLFWEIGTVEYSTLDNVRVKEPRFTLGLGRKLYDEDTGEPVFDDTGAQKAYVISRLIFHEDPDAALTIARREGIEVDETDEKAFLDEMRYLRCRDWLVECFFPTPIKKVEKKDMVIGGTVVETYSITSPNSEKIPFDDIKTAAIG